MFIYLCMLKKIHSEKHVVKIARVLKVISHPVRLQILAALREKDPLNVSELMDEVYIDVQQSMLSHHLIKMKENGVLTCSKTGTYVYYSIADPKLYNILDCMERCDFV